MEAWDFPGADSSAISRSDLSRQDRKVRLNRFAAALQLEISGLESLEAGIAQVAANVLIVEYPSKSFSQIKNLLSRFVRARRDLSEDVRRQLEELASCG